MMGRECSMHGRDDYAHNTWVGNLEDKRPLARHSRRWDDIKMHHTEIKSEVLNWIKLAQEGCRGLS
jgi:hypothetical protein